jgi:hypothetical protein
MKKLLAALAASTLVMAGHAQVAITSTNAPTFIASAATYLTTQNTNFDFASYKLDLETGYRQANGTGASSFAKLAYYVTPAIQLNAQIGYFGIGSPINSFEGGIGYAIYQKYDVRVTAEINGGYDANVRSGVVEPGFEAKKKMTKNTYASIGLYLPYYVGKAFNTSPTFTTGVGATF